MVPAIAEFERQLDRQGKYEAFQQALLAESGLEWKENRDVWGFYRDAIAFALQTAGLCPQRKIVRFLKIKNPETLTYEIFQPS